MLGTLVLVLTALAGTAAPSALAAVPRCTISGTAGADVLVGTAGAPVLFRRAWGRHPGRGARTGHVRLLARGPRDRLPVATRGSTTQRDRPALGRSRAR